MTEKWMLMARRADFYGLAEKFGVSPVLIRLLVNRGVRTEDDIRRYLYGTMEDEYSPHRMKGADEAAERILAAVRRGEKILVATDFDVDGVFSGQLFREAILAVGGSVTVRAPHRVKEGYGVNVGMVEQAHREGFSVLLTSDNGIAAFEAADRAEELGMEVIVTDHHECQARNGGAGDDVTLPAAQVVVDPHQPGETYPFAGLCGTGVAYKVAELLFEKAGLPASRREDFQEYLAIATVADVMDLADENRLFVKAGLRRLERTRKPGLRALIEASGLAGKKLTAYHIGFVLGPCFNTAGRLDTADRAFRLLNAGEAEAPAMAETLVKMNNSRKQMTADGVEKACAWVEAQPRLDDILVIPLPDCHESIAGIVAGKVRERYAHPVVVVTPSEHGWKGSGRSIENWNMFLGLSACRDLMIHFGGHPMAAGFSILEENIDELRRRVNENTGLTEEDFVPIIRIDVALPLERVSEELVGELELLEPCGKGNPRALFAENLFHIRSARVLGKNRNVLKLAVENRTGARMDALYFDDIPAFDELVRGRFGQEELARMYRGAPNRVCLSLAYYPQIDEYRGRRNLQIVIQHVR